MLIPGGEQAKPSPQVLKVEKKIKKQLEAEKSKTSQTALNEISQSIKERLSHDYNDRIKLKNRDIDVFDENKHPAKVHSHYVSHLLENLEKSISKSTDLRRRTKQ